MPDSARHHAYEIAGVCFLLIVLSLQLFLSVRKKSQTWDEGNHIFAGYRSWTHADFGLNPEHPPLVKLLATVPLLPLHPDSLPFSKSASLKRTPNNSTRHCRKRRLRLH
jgi:hypothetical protein